MPHLSKSSEKRSRHEIMAELLLMIVSSSKDLKSCLNNHTVERKICSKKTNKTIETKQSGFEFRRNNGEKRQVTRKLLDFTNKRKKADIFIKTVSLVRTLP